MQLFYAPEIKTKFRLPAEEAKHCIKILRHAIGDTLTVTDGKGYFYTCELLNTTNGDVKILQTDQEIVSRRHTLHIAIAPTKNGERTDWMIEKLVEFGIEEITFLNCEHNERTKINMERCTRIAISAMKQSLKATLPKLNSLVSLKEFIAATGKTDARKFIAHCNESEKRTELSQTTSTKKTICCIGPEGDFSKNEILLATANGFEAIALGKSRLRTETAAIAVGSYFYFN